MINNRQYRSAFTVKVNDIVRKLERVPYTDKSYDEEWLQDILAKEPSLLLSGEYDSCFDNLICIGREVPVGDSENKGYIDNLYVSSQGKVCIVETKLFRNQESRRTVVAQIIDYAKEISKWDSEYLNRIAGDYSFSVLKQRYSIIELFAKEGILTFADEASLNDNINYSLKSSEMLLLIVGDGIRSNVLELSEYINDSSMDFTLGLEEIEMYQDEDFRVVIWRRDEGRIIPYFKRAVSSDPVPTRKEFIDKFCKIGGFDSDLMTEFVYEAEQVDNISISVTKSELTVKFIPEDGYSYTLLTFACTQAQNKSFFWLQPKTIFDGMIRHGYIPNEASRFLEYYKSFIDYERCKYLPYVEEKRFFFGDAQKVFSNIDDFIEHLREFASIFSNN